MNKTRIDATGHPPRLTDGERLYPKSWSDSTSLAVFARGIAAWLGYADPKHESGKLIHQITKGTLRATEAWTDGRHDVDDKYVELDCERTMALASVTEGAARCTVLNVTEVEPSQGFVAWQALVDGYARKSSNDLAKALHPEPATPTRCKDAKELKEKLTAWSLKVAEYEHQFKVIDEAQKTFVVREMMPKDIKREFSTGQKKLDEIMGKLEIIINEKMADDGPVPMDLGNLRRRETRTRATTCRTTMCVRSRGKETKLAKEQAREDQTEQERRRKFFYNFGAENSRLLTTFGH